MALQYKFCLLFVALYFGSALLFVSADNPETPETCGDNAEHVSCTTHCNNNCDAKRLACEPPCHPGCVCKDGWLKNRSGICVKPDKCDP